MKVLKPRAALLSDYEVLKVLKDMEAEQKQRSQDAKDRKTSISSSSHTALAEPAQASAPAPGGEDDEWMQQVPENLRTIQYEVSLGASFIFQHTYQLTFPADNRLSLPGHSTVR